MYDLSLHLLDLMENSVRVGATEVRVTLEERGVQDELVVTIEDNGPGLTVGAETATDPFFTTKPGRRTGLGLSLFRAAVTAAGGSLTLGRSDIGGLRVSATMRIGHVDCKPLGDVASTVWSVAATAPDMEIVVRVNASGEERRAALSECRKNGERPGVAAANELLGKIQECLAILKSRDMVFDKTQQGES